MVQMENGSGKRQFVKVGFGKNLSFKGFACNVARLSSVNKASS